MSSIIRETSIFDLPTHVLPITYICLNLSLSYIQTGTFVDL